jgi:hypothetical protein
LHTLSRPIKPKVRPENKPPRRTRRMMVAMYQPKFESEGKTCTCLVAEGKSVEERVWE